MKNRNNTAQRLHWLCFSAVDNNGGKLFYLMKSTLVSFEDVRAQHLQYSLASSALTVLSSYHMTKLLKEYSTSDITTQIQVLTIITSFSGGLHIQRKGPTNKQIMGIFFMIMNILSKNRQLINKKYLFLTFLNLKFNYLIFKFKDRLRPPTKLASVAHLGRRMIGVLIVFRI